MAYDSAQLPVYELVFVPGSIRGTASVKSVLDGLQVVPCNDRFCCGESFHHEIPLDQRFKVLVEKRSKIMPTGQLKYFYVCHRFVEPRSYFEDRFQHNFDINCTGHEIMFLGGIGAAGTASCAVIRHGYSLLMVDCGVSVALLEKDTQVSEITEEGETKPESAYPDFSRLDDWLKICCLDGVLVTHGHLDHYGGLSELVKYLESRGQQMPAVYGHPFTTSMARSKCPEVTRDLKHVVADCEFNLGAFQVSAIPVCHSVPGSFSYLISLPSNALLQRILFTGDFKTRLRDSFDIFEIRNRLEKAAPDVLICDGTNALNTGLTPLASDVDGGLVEAIFQAKGRVFVTLFSTQIERVERLVRIANKMGKRIAVTGTSFNDSLQAAADASITINYQIGSPETADIVVVSGCQANDNSAAFRLSQGENIKGLRVEPDDTFVVSALPIPGRYAAVKKMAYGLRSLGAQVVLDNNFRDTMYRFDRKAVHVSGHGFAGDIETAIAAAKPSIFIPHHCGRAQQIRSAEIAASNGIDPANILLLDENSLVRF